MRMYDYGPSQNCFKVRLLAAHLRMELELVPVSIFEGEGASPEFLAKNPMGTVPLLETDAGEYLPESNAILAFLAEGTSYLPRDGLARAQVVRWLMFEQRYIQTSISRLRYWTLTGKLDQFAQDIGTARRLGGRVLDILDGEFEKAPFIACDSYTVADMSIFAYGHVVADAGFDLAR
jgi:glutathione S-transferase